MTVRSRPYRSPLRAEQARATRRRIVDAGRDLFVERGYGPTTIDAIADLLMHPLPYRRLVQLWGWTIAEYSEYLQQAAAAALLPPGTRRPRRTR